MTWEQKLRRLHEEATPASWSFGPSDKVREIAGVPPRSFYICGPHAPSFGEMKPHPRVENPADAALIVALRNSLPAVLQLVEAAREACRLFKDGGELQEVADALAALDAEAGD